MPEHFTPKGHLDKGSHCKIFKPNWPLEVTEIQQGKAQQCNEVMRHSPRTQKVDLMMLESIGLMTVQKFLDLTSNGVQIFNYLDHQMENNRNCICLPCKIKFVSCSKTCFSMKQEYVHDNNITGILIPMNYNNSISHHYHFNIV